MSRLTPGGFCDVQNRIADGIEAHALKFARQQAGRPLPRRDRLHLAAVALRHENDETRQVVGFCCPDRTAPTTPCSAGP